MSSDFLEVLHLSSLLISTPKRAAKMVQPVCTVSVIQWSRLQHLPSRVDGLLKVPHLSSPLIPPPRRAAKVAQHASPVNGLLGGLVSASGFEAAFASSLAHLS